MENEKIFIPMSLEDVGYSRFTFFNNKKLGYFLAFIILLALYISLIADLLKYNIILIINLILLISVSQWFIRKFVLEEGKWAELYYENSKNKVSDIMPLWGIYEITGDGIIKWRNLNQGYLIKLKKGSILGKPPNFREYHLRSISEFKKELTRRGYSYVSISVYEKPSYPIGFDYIDKNLESVNNKDLVNLINIQQNHLKKFLANIAKVEAEYFLIYADSNNLISEMNKVILNLTRELCEKSAFKEAEIQNRNQFLEFFMNLNNLKYIDYDSLLRYSNNLLTLKEKPFNVIKRYDENGIEVAEFEGLEDDSDKLIIKSTGGKSIIDRIGIPSLRKQQQVTDDNPVKIVKNTIIKRDDTVLKDAEEENDEIIFD